MRYTNIETSTTTSELANEPVSANWNYTVEATRLHDSEGNATSFIGNRRADTNQVIGVRTNRYGIVQNRDLLGSAENLFNAHSMGGWSRKTVVTHGGARMYALYDFRDQSVTVAKGDNLFLRLKVQNSFDGSLGASFTVGMFRLVCSNGLALPVNTISLAKKHTTSLDVDFMSKGITRALLSFKDSVPFLTRMTEVAVTRQQGITAIENLVKRGDLSARMSKEIVAKWESPTYEQDSPRTAWSLYNAATEYLTHDVAPKRFELAEKVTASFATALRKGGMMEGQGLYIPQAEAVAV
jgi:hypothetical protein